MNKIFDNKVLRYAIFAAVSILANMITQYCITKVTLVISAYFTSLLSKQIIDTLIVYCALASGTGVGLLVKYILDKKFIFFYEVTSKTDDVQKFALYSMMGIVTTVIFWGSELLFYYMFHFSAAKYVGGIIGLIIGYITKYHLDKRWVFVNNL